MDFIGPLLFVGVFSLLFFLAYTFVWDATPPPFLEDRSPVRKGINAASLTTADRREQTLNNPVVTFKGQQVYLNVEKNPAR
jgi:hypothetical protein